MILHELRMKRKSTIIWSIVMFAMIAVSMVKGAAIISDPAAADAMAALPKSIGAIFGLNSLDIATPYGYYSILYIYIAISLGIHGCGTAISLFTNEEIDHTYEYIMTKPVNRMAVVRSKIIAALIIITIVNVVTALGGYLGMLDYYADYPDLFNQFLMLSFNTYLFVLLMVGISYLMLGLFPKSSKVSMYSSSLILIFYFINVIASMFDEAGIYYYLTPFQFMGPVDIYNNTISPIGYILTPIVLICGIWALFNSFKSKDF